MTTGPYCPKFNAEFKERVRAFFNYTCQVCGRMCQPNEPIRMAVHHVNYKKETCCDERVKPLFVPTCSGKCHIETNHHRTFWEDWFTEVINEFYGGKCYYTKEEMKSQPNYLVTYVPLMMDEDVKNSLKALTAELGLRSMRILIRKIFVLVSNDAELKQRLKEVT
jgi:hypothetical protein